MGFVDNSGILFIAKEAYIRRQLRALPRFLGKKDTEFPADAIKMPCYGTR
jgi:hypothetical protein